MPNIVSPAMKARPMPMIRITLAAVNAPIKPPTPMPTTNSPSWAGSSVPRILAPIRTRAASMNPVTKLPREPASVVKANAGVSP